MISGLQYYKDSSIYFLSVKKVSRQGCIVYFASDVVRSTSIGGAYNFPMKKGRIKHVVHEGPFLLQILRGAQRRSAVQNPLPQFAKSANMAPLDKRDAVTPRSS